MLSPAQKPSNPSILKADPMTVHSSAVGTTRDSNEGLPMIEDNVERNGRKIARYAVALNDRTNEGFPFVAVISYSSSNFLGPQPMLDDAHLVSILGGCFLVDCTPLSTLASASQPRWSSSPKMFRRCPTMRRPRPILRNFSISMRDRPSRNAFREFESDL